MRIECERCLVFAAGLIVGAGAYAMVKNGKAQKAAVKALAKGMELQEKVAAAAERTKESVADTIAEAKCCMEEEK